ncbi:ribonuclease P protein subunit p38 [Notolabrus celidotus]|uniref:ribonuclease P protein subunit p38 n=1 Tax=Notolabrus celidotus TaxID=1203425 RepID=UPI00148F6A50|nr:ribonuclease P protein subunit p38 [Notolabrus celidotus]XP_034553397.1 ribonuclease P protein subunit p38 [Notolabrus celidotus]
MAPFRKLSKKERRLYVQSKTCFISPITPTWSPLPQDSMHFILNTLKDKLLSTGLQKKEIKVFRPWKKKTEKNPASSPESVSEMTQDDSVQDSPKNGWTNVAARRQLAIGVNEVTKALERSELKLLLVCKSVKPKHMTDHLIALSVTRGVPACQVPRLSQSLSEPLGLKSVLALGFRHCASNDDDMFTDTVEAITPRVPSLDVAWLHGAAQSVQPQDQIEPEKEVEEEEVEEEEGEGVTNKGQKRKLKSEPEVTESAPSCTLLPLKVRKIIPNPARKRKTKPKS